VIMDFELPNVFIPPPADGPHPQVDLSEHSLPKFRVLFYQNVKNASSLRKKIIAQDPEIPDCVMINATMILDFLQIQLACFKSYIAQKNDNLKTRSLLSEILYNLSPSTSISDALRQFGLSDGLKSLIVVLLGSDSENNVTHKTSQLSKLIEGDISNLNDQPKIVDVPAIVKYFKLDERSITDREHALSLIVGAMALKGLA
ncbi:hypothetical protein HK096_003372, partial [Nowakowskiella sp. JEL0078]